jgi:flagellar biosynthetic protein FliO
MDLAGEDHTMIGDFGAASIKMVGSLILILGLIICLFYFLKKFRPNVFPLGKDPMMRLVGTLNLAPKRSLALVEICGQWLVVGIGTESVALVSKVDRPEATGEPYENPGSKGKGFHSIFNKKVFGALAAKEDDGN